MSARVHTDGSAVMLPLLIIDLLIFVSGHFTRRLVCVSAKHAPKYIQYYFTEMCILESSIHFYLNMELTDMCSATVHSVTLNVAYVLTVNA
jgi:hypothetical protein